MSHWDDLGKTIEKFVNEGKTIEVGKSGPYREKGQEFFAHITSVRGFIERTGYGTTPTAALEAVFSDAGK